MDVHSALYKIYWQGKLVGTDKMVAIVLSTNPFMPLPRSFSVEYATPPLSERVGVIALVLVIHLAVGMAWWMQPEQPAVAVNEMSVSLAMQVAPVVEPPPVQPPEPPKPQPKVERSEQPTTKPVQREMTERAPQVLPLAPPPPSVPAAPAVATAPVVDTEPDYKASYLNNPRPPYPMVARRMSWDGRVILNVEVLAEGACGAVSVLSSSGHEVLDNAAMNTVKTWRFIPAKRAGRAFTQWFKVPINFSLEESEV